MQQILNGFCDYYYISEDAEVYNAKTKHYLGDSYGFVSLKKESGERQNISIKNLYKLVFGKELIIDDIPDLEGERWVEIPNTDRKYFASSKGRIKSFKTGRAKILKPYVNKQGYLRVDILYADGKRSSWLVNRLIASCFLYAPNTVKYDVHHIDGDKNNNAVENLVFMTPEKHQQLHTEQKKKEGRI